MRLIDTDKLLEKTECLFKDLNSTEDYMGIGYNHGVGDSIAIIKNAPTIEAEPVKHGRWIPVSERLPDYGKTVLITNDKGNVRSGRFRGVEFWKDDGDAYWTFKGNTVEHVLAWMPLPEPYKEEAETEHEQN